MSNSTSNFPNELDYPDDTCLFSDTTSDDWAKWKTYIGLVKKGTEITDDERKQIEDILASTANKRISADDINKIINCIRKIEQTVYPISQGSVEGDLKVKGKIYGCNGDDYATLGFNGGDVYVNADGNTFNSPIFKEDGVNLENKYLQKNANGKINGNLTINGDLSVDNISGDGSNITNVDADTVRGKSPEDFAKAEHSHLKGTWNSNGGMYLVGYGSGNSFPEGFYKAPDVTYSNEDGTLFAPMLGGDGSQVTNVNASTLNGKTANDFVSNFSILGSSQFDVDTLLKVGIYDIEMAINVPDCMNPTDENVGVSGSMIITSSNEECFRQLWLPETSNELYSRYYDSSGWSNWTTMKSSGTSVSGDFALVDHTHNYLKSSYEDKENISTDSINIENGRFTAECKEEQSSSKVIIDGDGIVASSEYETTPIISGFSSISTDKFIGDGSSITNVNATMLSGLNINDIQTKITDYAPYTDWNDIKQSGYYGLMKAESTNAPNNTNFFYPLVFSYSSDGITQFAIPYKYRYDTSFVNGVNCVYMRFCASGTWTDWSVLGEGCNATTLNGFLDTDFQKLVSGEQNVDWNTLTKSGMYPLMSRGAINAPTDLDWYFPIVFAYSETGFSQMAVAYRSNDIFLRRYIKNTDTGVYEWSEWTKLGENASTLNKFSKNFTVSLGSWYRLATNNLDACGGVFVLNVGSGGCSSTTVFSASQQYSIDEDNEKKISILSHSGFNNCVTKLRLVNKYDTANVGVYQYVDFYVENGEDGATGNLEVQFFGKGWKILSSINTANVVDGCTVTEIEL